MPCPKCPEWVINSFICNVCSTVFNYRHRKGDNPVKLALNKGGRCPNCSSRDFRYNG